MQFLHVWGRGMIEYRIECWIDVSLPYCLEDVDSRRLFCTWVCQFLLGLDGERHQKVTYAPCRAVLLIVSVCRVVGWPVVLHY